MRFPTLMLTAAIVAGCGGHNAAPASAPAPAATAPAARAAEPTAMRYAAGNGRYRYEQVQHLRQDMMGQVQETDATTTLIVTTAMTPGENGNLNAAITVDSVGVTTNPAGNPNALDALRGKTFHAVYSPLGKSVSFTPPDTMAATALSGEIFREFLPALPTATVAGTMWTDTVVAPPVSAQGMRVTSTSIRSHRVVGWETRDGARVLHITTNGNYTLNGEGQQGGATLLLQGTGAALSERWVSASGVYLGTTVNDSTNVRVNVVSAGIEIPVNQTRRTTVTRLP